MSFSDPIGDMLTRIRNAQARGHETVMTPASNMRGRVLNVLKAKGYIEGFEEEKHEGGKKDYSITLRYFEGEPVIKELKRVSKPGRRVYSSAKDLKPSKNGLGIYIVSTPRGVMCDYDARANNVGGEVIGSVY